MTSFYIAPDASNEPTLWTCDEDDHRSESCDCPTPKALTRFCDVGNERAWAVLVVGMLTLNGGVA